MNQISISVTPESKQLVERLAVAHTRLPGAVDAGLGQIAGELATATQVEGFEPWQRSLRPSPGSSGKLFMRSRRLRNEITAGKDGPLDHWVGTATPVRHAWLLGGETKTIRPVNAKFLTIPIGENLTASGEAKQTAREAIDSGAFFHRTKSGKLLILKSKGEGKGVQRLFVLVRSVTITGRRVIGTIADKKGDRMRRILRQQMEAALGPDN